jgi:geranylgeranyl pyrophosphate synthase
MTLAVIHLLAHGDARAAALVRDIVRNREATIEQWRELRALLSGSGSIDYAYRAALDHVDRAKRALRAFAPGPAREALAFLPDYVLSRDR